MPAWESVKEVNEPMTALGELARHEIVRRMEVRKSWEVGEGRVRGKDQDERRGHLKHEEQPVTDGATSEHGAPHLRDDGLRLAGDHLQLHGDVRQAEEHRPEE